MRRLSMCFILLVTSPIFADDFIPMAQNKIVPADSKLERLWNEGSFTEGPTLTEDGSILFSDIGNRIMKFDPKTKSVTVFRGNSGKANGLMHNRKGRLIACEGAAGGNRRLSITNAKGKVRTLADSHQGKKFNSPNDLAIDAKGNIYMTDPRYGGDEPRELDFEGVFYITRKGEVTLATKDVEKPNGIVISLDGKTVYVADNNSKADGNHHLVAFTVKKDGTLTDKKILFDIGPDRRGIDGMTTDIQGNIYATAGRGDLAGIYVFNPQGKHMAFIPTPGDPTNCVFGGKDEPTTLYITAGGTDGKFALYRIKLTTPGVHLWPKQK